MQVLATGDPIGHAAELLAESQIDPTIVVDLVDVGADEQHPVLAAGPGVAAAEQRGRQGQRHEDRAMISR